MTRNLSHVTGWLIVAMITASLVALPIAINAYAKDAEIRLIRIERSHLLILRDTSCSYILGQAEGVLAVDNVYAKWLAPGTSWSFNIIQPPPSLIYRIDYCNFLSSPYTVDVVGEIVVVLVYN